MLMKPIKTETSVAALEAYFKAYDNPRVEARNALLDRAANVMGQRGLAQQTFENLADGSICTMGCLFLAAGLPANPYAAGLNPYLVLGLQDLRDAVSALGYLVPFPQICAWKNEPGRTKEDGVNALLAAKGQPI